MEYFKDQHMLGPIPKTEPVGDALLNDLMDIEVTDMDSTTSAARDDAPTPFERGPTSSELNELSDFLGLRMSTWKY